MEHLPAGKIVVRNDRMRDPVVKAAVDRLRDLGVHVSSPADRYDYELRLEHSLDYPKLVLVEIGYLLAQLTDNAFPEEYEGFGWYSGRVPYAGPKRNAQSDESIRVDTDPKYLSFRIRLKQDKAEQSAR